MAKFLRHKTLDEITEQCAAAGLVLKRDLYDKGSDHVSIRNTNDENDPSITLYSPFNGKFFGVTPDGIAFNSDNTEHDNEHWFKALLIFFLVAE